MHNITVHKFTIHHLNKIRKKKKKKKFVKFVISISLVVQLITYEKIL
jgi:hypothetical protein